MSETISSASVVKKQKQKPNVVSDNLSLKKNSYGLFKQTKRTNNQPKPLTIKPLLGEMNYTDYPFVN